MEPHATTAEASTSSTRTSERKTFLDLPAELRNEIYALTLHTDSTFDITHGWPSILLARRQIYHEALPIFLARSALTVHIRDRRDGPLTGWLEVVKELPTAWKASISTVTITFSGHILDEDRVTERFVPEFALCDHLITCIKAAGLRADQVKWGALRAEDNLEALSQEEIYDHIAPIAILNQWVIPKLLVHHRFVRHDWIHTPEMTGDSFDRGAGMGFTYRNFLETMHMLRDDMPPEESSRRMFEWWAAAGGLPRRRNLRDLYTGCWREL